MTSPLRKSLRFAEWFNRSYIIIIIVFTDVNLLHHHIIHVIASTIWRVREREQKILSGGFIATLVQSQCARCQAEKFGCLTFCHKIWHFRILLLFLCHQQCVGVVNLFKKYLFQYIYFVRFISLFSVTTSPIRGTIILT